MAFEIPKFNPSANMFQPVSAPGAVGGQSTAGTGGSGVNRGTQTPFEADMANFRSFLPQNNGTGDLQPANNAKFNLMA